MPRGPEASALAASYPGVRETVDTEAAPRVAVAGPLVSMIARPQLDLGDPPIVQVATPEQARALVEKELPFRPNYIKVFDPDELVFSIR